MKPLLVYYPKCGTCRKAIKWLAEKGIDVNERHIVEHPPTRNELEVWHRASGLELKKFFNTSGRKYRELDLKERIPSATHAELLDILASDGMLVKRPVLVTNDKVLVGFRETEWEQALQG